MKFAKRLASVSASPTLHVAAEAERLRRAGFDVVDYSADAVAESAPGLSITIDGTTVTAVNAALGETEVATNVEAVVGSLGDDVVIGDGADNLLIAGGGDDQFDGGDGSDTVRFDTAAVVDLAGTTQILNGTLVLTNVENVTGSASADILRGSVQANTLIGGLGDDVLMGRGGGKIQGGRALDYRGQPNRQMCRLYLSMLDKAGLPQKQFGDATEPLNEV